MQTERMALLNAHVAAENAHRMAETLATLHQDCLFEDMATGQVFHGRAGAEAHYRQWWDAFGLTFSRGAEDRGHWTEDGSYVGQGRFEGRHVGTFLGIPPTGKLVSYRFCVFVGFRDGLMAGERFYYDLAGLLRQVDAADWRPEAAA
ncbi:ester cyclase [Phreatobacter stygius]|uniref:Ester cyclase n=1 Tax=Phreatobacter stygius TaxID=1940610 RepID=A0A4D7AQ77_9HYPH|nr:ester cyclase [Phreatobacter stygius]QCI63139.1 hypothetical protein E8M01_02135 [Phreatobacter stygius]